MAVSKRTRFEVLRRCNFACFYCGLPAPVVTLQVDHVVPQARGGTDHAWNLVAACRDCNAGKLDGVPLASTIDRVLCDWKAYVEGRGEARLYCYVCRRPIDPEDAKDWEDEFAQCSPCSEAIWDAYEAGMRAARSAP